MIFDVLTLFPQIFASFLAESLLARAIAQKIVSVNLIDIRDYADGPRRICDDRPYGGGPGMVLKPEPIARALDALLLKDAPPPTLVYLAPAGKLLTQSLALSLSQKPRLILLCGRYEGVDHRIVELYRPLRLSIGDYVLNGGEVPAMALIECVARLRPGFLGEKLSAEDESFASGLLEAPPYTRPRMFRGLAPPEILFSGNHAAIERYRDDVSRARTMAERPELLDPQASPAETAETLETPETQEALAPSAPLEAGADGAAPGGPAGPSGLPKP
ncbi:MAG: tRNA (guanosine(37)-N1)-methyltransferase TrmD [Deltaproteobacteria bacterium]|nr:tRNA (guanosine(37)-N1)-methyltransferase TrmD [Deltaproteobacteria bacterium]